MTRHRTVLAGLAAAALAVAGVVATAPDEVPEGRGAAVAEVSVPGQPPAITHGNDPLPERPPGLLAAAAPEHPWPCEGTGEDGRRVQLLYAHTGSGNLEANRAAFEAVARRIEGTFMASAREGGGERLVRFVTGRDCALSILEVGNLSTDAMGSFDAMIGELSARSFNRRDRIYHAWTESTAYCGIGTVYTDDRPAGNFNEQFAQYSRSDRPCWNYAEAHEITHNLGAVQNSAPNSTGGLHTRDEHDVMSYPDGAPNGVMIQPFPCPDAALELRLDCRDDDYFTAGTPTGYLATHWNAADASALARTVVSTTSTIPPTTSTSTTSTSTTSTTVGRGRTITDLSVTRSPSSGVPFTAAVTVTGTCRPTGFVVFYVSGREKSRQPLVDGRASATLVVSEPGRYTVRADYLGSTGCAASRDTTRPTFR